MSKPVYEIPLDTGQVWPDAGGRRRSADAPPSFEEIMRPRNAEQGQDATAAAPAPGPSLPPVNMPAPGAVAPPAAPIMVSRLFSQPAPLADTHAQLPPTLVPAANAAARLATPPVAPFVQAATMPAPQVLATHEAVPEVVVSIPAPLEATPPAQVAYQFAPAQPLPAQAAPIHALPQQALQPVHRPTETVLTAEASPGAPVPGDGQEGSDPRIVQALNAVVIALASDLHVSAGAPPMIRVDGELRPIAAAPVWQPDDLRAALYSIMSSEQQEIFERELELDFAYTLSGTTRFRVNIFQQREALGGAFRLIPTEIKQLHELGVPESVGNFAKLSRGLVLVTGPTGSGKSTTLAALVDLVNRTRTDHIMTVEDPIEFLHGNHKSLVNQREVGNDTHSFAAALKHVLRQDPDVILVGELRDLETVSVALTAAETGHLVFATLHTQDAAQTIDRIIDVFPPHQQGQVRAQLAATLQGVVCQTLIKKASGKGRVVATEVLVATPAINNLIREGKTYQISSSMQAGREHGMFTMDQHLAELVNSGQITVRAAYEKCHDEETLKRLISRQETRDGGGMTGGIDFGDRYSAGGK
ncbi:twitching motility protein PilT [Salinibacterium xinjiangense]|uniref:Twitching motility protein PilT n=2 Tax=Salinibacterium xinjiangense TaxID=386302 RepID=A0A2C8Z7I0_9MICO|nr:twitching motility protein PilT [Salinibacterium xinjiangense]